MKTIKAMLRIETADYNKLENVGDNSFETVDLSYLEAVFRKFVQGREAGTVYQICSSPLVHYLHLDMLVFVHDRISIEGVPWDYYFLKHMESKKHLVERKSTNDSKWSI